MWLNLLLFCLVGFAYGDHNPGWQHNYEYVYHLRGRSVASLNQISSNCSGIFIKAQLAIRPTPDGDLKALISNAQYADIHQPLQDDWRQEIPDSELRYQDIPCQSGTFKMKMDNGVVRDLVVDQTIPNWEANMIKAVVSQLQLDTDAENYIPSSITMISANSNNAVFKTMEETVTGESETLYELHPFPEHVLQTEPWLAPLRNLKGQGEFIEVVKNKNFTHSQKVRSYYFGFQGIEDFDIQNKIGDFFARTSVSRAILSGNVKNFTLQSSVTVEETTMNPNFQDKQRGSANSLVNLTLHSMQPQNQEFPDVANPMNVGVVYKYNNPFGDSNQPQRKSLGAGSSESSESDESSQRLSHNQNSYSQFSSSESGAFGASNSAGYSGVQPQPPIDQPPASPLLPFTVGYQGRAISMVQNIKVKVATLAKDIGQKVQQPQNIPVQNILGKILTLSSLIKVMNRKEMQEVGAQLYTEEVHGAAAATWVAYRDAVSQAGTGPALLVIEQWIASGNIYGNVAAQVVAVAAHSAREPTQKYMEVFFEMVKNEKASKQEYLNESLILSYTTLVHNVYVNPNISQHKYPVYSFGKFNTEEGLRFVKDSVIPYLTQKLQKAVSKADTKNIHLYIRALGNVGHQQILSAFKPYLEGTEKASQFQRILMVLALDNLVSTEPKVARSVLYRIYQNSRDLDQVRVAAVYQLMQTNPPPSMLQKMAMYTNVDTNKHVNSAVKSAIQSVANLKEAKFAQVRAAAQSAEPLLTSKEFGVQNSKQTLRNYVVEQMQLEVKETIQTLGGEDSMLPKGINYLLRGRLGGLKREVVKMQSHVSSIEDLIDVIERLTKPFRYSLKQKQSYESIKKPFSSEWTANLLKMQNEQREQLEGFLYLHLDALQKTYSFDNHTIENLTEVVKELEAEFNSGKHWDFTRMSSNPESALSFPNAWGLPFIYTHDRPSIMHLETKASVHAKPSIYNKDGLQKPKEVKAQLEINGFVSSRVQSQFGFFIPFNSRRYSAGYDKNFQILLPPILAKIDFNVERNQLTTVIETGARQNTNLLHFSSWPYTSQYQIDDAVPKTHIIRSMNPQIINTVLGKESTGLALPLHLESDETVDYASVYEKFDNNNPASLLLGSWLNDNIQHVEINLGLDVSKSTTNKITVHLGHKSQFTVSSHSGSSSDGLLGDSRVAEESLARQNALLRNLSQGMRSARSQVYDAIVLFQGKSTHTYRTTFGEAKSIVDSKQRVQVQVERDSQQAHYLRANFSATSNLPSPPSLNLEAALDFDPTTTIVVKGVIEEKDRSPSQVRASIKLSKSEDREQYLKEQPRYKECQKQMQEGNNQLPACASLTAEANLLNQFSVSVNHNGISPDIVNSTYKSYSMLREYIYPRISENINRKLQDHGLGVIHVNGQFSADLSTVNASIVSRYGSAQITNVPIDDAARNLLVGHPVYGADTRVTGYVLDYNAYQPLCVLDKSAVSTLDNKTFPVNLSKDWVVLLHYVPRRPSSKKNQPELPVTEQLNQQLEDYIIFGRAGEANPAQKEVKMVIQSPKTKGQVVDITVKPSDSSSGYPRLYIENEQIIYDNEGTHLYDDYMQVYKLPKNEIIVGVYDSFNVVYDGNLAKITIVNDKFRDSSRGICGTFTGEPETDFTSPTNCILRYPETFVAQHTIDQQQRNKRMNDMLMIQTEEKKCYQKTVGYVKVISAQDSGLTRGARFADLGMEYRTKYVLLPGRLGRHGRTCFSIDELPVCRSGYKEYSVSRTVRAHCVAASKVANLYKQQIDAGIKIRLSHKTATENVEMQVAERCE